MVITHVIDFTPAVGGNANGFSEGTVPLGGGVVRDTGQDSRGQAEDKGVGDARRSDVV